MLKSTPWFTRERAPVPVVPEKGTAAGLEGWKNVPTPEFEPRAIKSVETRNTDYVIPPATINTHYGGMSLI